MTEAIRITLIGPFPMSDPPLTNRPGWYRVQLRERFDLALWYWTGADWSDEDDGLGDTMNVHDALAWYGSLGLGNAETHRLWTEEVSAQIKDGVRSDSITSTNSPTPKESE